MIMIQIAPSILSADFSRLAEEIAAVEAAGADIIHLDVMDGHFVPNITIGPAVVAALRKTTRLPFDVHLMIENADLYLEQFADAGSDMLTVHIEATNHLHRMVTRIRELKIKAGVSLNPATPLIQASEIMPWIDHLLIMTVNPGFGGQKFIGGMLAKIRKAKEMILSLGVNTLIEVDGGVNKDNIASVAAAGADIIVAGNAIFGQPPYGPTIGTMRSILNNLVKPSLHPDYD